MDAEQNDMPEQPEEPADEALPEEEGQDLMEGLATILDQLEEAVPAPLRRQVREYPAAALLVGLAAGILLGMKKGDDILAAGTAFVASAATARFARNFRGDHEGD